MDNRPFSVTLSLTGTELLLPAVYNAYFSAIPVDKITSMSYHYSG